MLIVTNNETKRCRRRTEWVAGNRMWCVFNYTQSCFIIKHTSPASVQLYLALHHLCSSSGRAMDDGWWFDKSSETYRNTPLVLVRRRRCGHWTELNYVNCTQFSLHFNHRLMCQVLHLSKWAFLAVDWIPPAPGGKKAAASIMALILSQCA